MDIQGRTSQPTPLVSIILPCFNSSKSVSWTVKSVLAQAYANIELICVNDASTDDTLAILHEIALSDPRVKVLSNEQNSGLGPTRNNGIEQAKGEILAFVDDDDFYEVDFVDVMVKAMLENKADLVQCAIRYVYADANKVVAPPAGIIDGEQCRFRVDTFDGLPYLTPQAWNKIYRRKLFETARYKPIGYEDAEVLPTVLRSCDRIVCLAEPLYNYNKRFSRITGVDTVNLNKVPWYLDSLFTSIKPYFSAEFLAVLRKWNAPLPVVTYSNLSNYLRSLDRSAANLNWRDRRKAASELRRVLARLREIVPADVAEEYFAKIFEPKALLHGARGAQLVKIAKAAQKLLVEAFELTMPWVDRLIRKDENTWVFSSWGHYERHTMDSPRAVYEVVKNDAKIKKVVLMNGNFISSPVASDGANLEFLRLHSAKGLYFLMRAGKVFTAYSLHNIFGYRRLRSLPARKIIQLWHGIPIKKVGLKVAVEPWWTRETKRYHFLPSSSEVDRDTMTASFSPSVPDVVKVTGLPRHDFLAMADDQLPSDYRAFLDTLKDRLGGRRLVMFAPTWRYGEETPCMLTDEQLVALDALFRRSNAVLGIRLHRNMMKLRRPKSFVSDSVIYLNDIPDVNLIMRVSEAIVTDYSSLYLDAMKLNVPILLYTPDVDTYSGSRGFNYTPREFIPHEYEIRSFDDLLDKLSRFLEGQLQIDSRYGEVLARFHAFGLDASSSSRVLAAIE